VRNDAGCVAPQPVLTHDKLCYSARPQRRRAAHHTLAQERVLDLATAGGPCGAPAISVWGPSGSGAPTRRRSWASPHVVGCSGSYRWGRSSPRGRIPGPHAAPATAPTPPGRRASTPGGCRVARATKARLGLPALFWTRHCDVAWRMLPHPGRRKARAAWGASVGIAETRTPPRRGTGPPWCHRPTSVWRAIDQSGVVLRIWKSRVPNES